MVEAADVSRGRANAAEGPVMHSRGKEAQEWSLEFIVNLSGSKSVLSD